MIDSQVPYFQSHQSLCGQMNVVMISLVRCSYTEIHTIKVKKQLIGSSVSIFILLKYRLLERGRFLKMGIV
jgi:hypothetical protein